MAWLDWFMLVFGVLMMVFGAAFLDVWSYRPHPVALLAGISVTVAGIYVIGQAIHFLREKGVL